MSDQRTLANVVGQFIVTARDKYGLGRFMPDELPLLDEMARLAARVQAEERASKRKHVSTGHRLEFTYRPTPPSGPPPSSVPAVPVGEASAAACPNGPDRETGEWPCDPVSNMDGTAREEP